jgi:hypothetical protein
LPGTTLWIDNKVNKGLLVGAGVGLLGAVAAGTGIALSMKDCTGSDCPGAAPPTPPAIVSPINVIASTSPTYVQRAREMSRADEQPGSSALIGLLLLGVCLLLCCIGLCVGLCYMFKGKGKGRKTTPKKAPVATENRDVPVAEPTEPEAQPLIPLPTQAPSYVPVLQPVESLYAPATSLYTPNPYAPTAFAVPTTFAPTPVLTAGSPYAPFAGQVV